MNINTETKLTNNKSFTSPTGAHFPAGTTFTVIIGGETAGRSLKLSADQCGSVVWLSDGIFLADTIRPTPGSNAPSS